MGDKSIEIILNVLENSKLQVLEAVDSLVDAYVGVDKNLRKQCVENTVRALNQLKGLLSVADQPQWIGLLERRIHDRVQDRRSERLFLLSLGGLRRKLEVQNWRDVIEGEKVPDIAEVTDRIYVESDFPTKFEALAKLLEDAIMSGHIQHVSAIKELKRLIALIRANAMSSYASAAYILPFAGRLIANIVKQYSMKALGPVGSAIDETYRKMAEEWPDTRMKVEQAVVDATQRDLPELPPPPSHEDFETAEVIEGYVNRDAPPGHIGYTASPKLLGTTPKSVIPVPPGSVDPLE